MNDDTKRKFSTWSDDPGTTRRLINRLERLDAAGKEKESGKSEIQDALEAGYMTINQARERFAGLPPVPRGGRGLQEPTPRRIPRNLRPKLRWRHALVYLVAAIFVVFGTEPVTRWVLVLAIVMSYDIHLLRVAAWDIAKHLQEEEGLSDDGPL